MIAAFQTAVERGELPAEVFKIEQADKVYDYNPVYYDSFFKVLVAKVQQILGSIGRRDLFKYASMIAFRQLCLCLPNYTPASLQFTIGDKDDLRVESHATAPVFPDWVEKELGVTTARLEEDALGLLLIGQKNL